MVFIKHNSLKSDLYFNPISIPCFSGSRFFRVQVFQDPGFSGSRFLGCRFFRFQACQGPGFSGSGSRVQVQSPGPGFRSSLGSPANWLATSYSTKFLFEYMLHFVLQKAKLNTSILRNSYFFNCFSLSITSDMHSHVSYFFCNF